MVCDYHREGDHRFHYSLKKEFMLESDQQMITAETEKRRQEQLTKMAKAKKWWVLVWFSVQIVRDYLLAF